MAAKRTSLVRTQFSYFPVSALGVRTHCIELVSSLPLYLIMPLLQ